MSARLLDGQKLAGEILRGLSRRSRAFRRKRGRSPCLAIVAGNHPASQSYLKSKLRACALAGVRARLTHLEAGASLRQASSLVKKLARDAAVDAIMIELPLPVPEQGLIELIPSSKDAEGLTAASFGRLFQARNFQETENLPVPCTAAAVIALLQSAGVAIRSKRAAVLGRSNILGKPTAHLLTLLDATVTLCHSKTKDLKKILAQADLAVAGIGRPRFIKGSWLKRGAAVIDAGINIEGRAVRGDVDFKSARGIAAYISPVPGGVGPVTTAMLLRNTLVLAEAQLK